MSDSCDMCNSSYINFTILFMIVMCTVCYNQYILVELSLLIMVDVMARAVIKL